MSENIEVWRVEFEKIITENHKHLLPLRLSPLDKYLYMGTEALWQGFLMAKRSLPVIELPEAIGTDERPDYYHGYDDAINSVIETITAAGYQYKVKS